MIREWLKPVDEIDRDCIHWWEKLLGIKFRSYEDYSEIDSWIEDMILDYDTKEELIDVYPNIEYNVRKFLGLSIKMTKKEAAAILSDIIGEEYHQAAFIDFESSDEKEKNMARAWEKRTHALAMAIKCLEGK